MGKDLNSRTPAGGPPRPDGNLGAVRKLVNGVLVSVGTVYLATNSIVVTIIAAAVAVALAALYLIARR
ncbi:hypothetical protein SAMN05421835_11492 [Amycolatopsis sacchari]|uniref:Uncharacterized protein n=1 Tax=Amycolatopsis sacchari TaxID=115433 RepID=A0A1I3X188_9PSEU|nr:hypothetical protein SAMN05421835_11492 [Amycolatopsis sacchari]